MAKNHEYTVTADFRDRDSDNKRKWETHAWAVDARSEFEALVRFGMLMAEHFDYNYLETDMRVHSVVFGWTGAPPAE